MERQPVDIGPVVLDAVLAGHGEATVVFENGLGTSLEQWEQVVGPLVDRAKVLRYDRRRARLNGPVSPHSADQSADDLSRLLAAATLAPPYVLVGHSWGGVIIRRFAHAHPTQVAGMVLVDATHEALDAPGLALLPAMYTAMAFAARIPSMRRRLVNVFCPPEAPAPYRLRVAATIADPQRWRLTLRTARAESASIRSSLEALRRDCPALPAIPVYVLTGQATGAAARSASRVHAAWERMVRDAANARYETVAHSGHHIPLLAPDVVSRAIVRVLAAVESGEVLAAIG